MWNTGFAAVLRCWNPDLDDMHVGELSAHSSLASIAVRGPRQILKPWFDKSRFMVPTFPSKCGNPREPAGTLHVQVAYQELRSRQLRSVCTGSPGMQSIDLA
jgi:hypothetical protein